MKFPKHFHPKLKPGSCDASSADQGIVSLSFVSCWSYQYAKRRANDHCHVVSCTKKITKTCRRCQDEPNPCI